MKRIFGVLLIVIFLFFTGIYIFIPRNIVISKVTLINCNIDGASRIVLQPTNWQKWTNAAKPFAANSTATGNLFTYNGTSYEITKLLHNSIDVVIKSKNFRTNSVIRLFPLSDDSIAVQWKTEIITGFNPFERIQLYRQAISIKKDMTDILANLRSFLENKKNVYHISIQKTSTIDTVMVATKSVSAVYPATQIIYDKIKFLQDYISAKGATQTGAPMVNITKPGNGQYQCMVAVPTNTALPEEQNIFVRKMVRGNFLVTEVKGGENTVNEAMNNMQLYISDYKKTSMAIPFQSLLTDRSKEPDSSKWITKIYFPIYY